MKTLTSPDSRVLAFPAGRTLRLEGAPVVMAVLNLTPDSFSDGGLFRRTDRAVERALEMERQGANLIDLGAESTRPGGGVYGEGAREVPPDEELERLLPVLEALRPLTRLPISVDTRKAEVARRALASGADLVNDVSALGDPQMAEVVAAADVPVILMHSRGELGDMQRRIAFEDVVREVVDELGAKVDDAVAAGIDRPRILVDPGIGFGKTAQQNLALLRHLDSLRALGRPIVVGASRKSFLGELTGRAPGERLAGSLAVAAWSAARGVDVVRVHDVRETVELLTTWRAIAHAPDGAPGEEDARGGGGEGDR